MQYSLPSQFVQQKNSLKPVSLILFSPVICGSFVIPDSDMKNICQCGETFALVLIILSLWPQFLLLLGDKSSFSFFYQAEKIYFYILCMCERKVGDVNLFNKSGQTIIISLIVAHCAIFSRAICVKCIYVFQIVDKRKVFNSLVKISKSKHTMYFDMFCGMANVSFSQIRNKQRRLMECEDQSSLNYDEFPSQHQRKTQPTVARVHSAEAAWENFKSGKDV